VTDKEKMERDFSTGQSPQWAVVLKEEEEKEEEEEVTVQCSHLIVAYY
jgi:hypothetical protein